MSELISSRTWRAFSRAAVTHARTESRFERSNTRASTSAAGAVGASAARGSRNAVIEPAEIPPIRIRPAIESQVEAHIEQPRGVFRALQIAADPVQGVGNSRQQHGPIYSSRTHVSLLPPPCDEFTTSDPLLSATRVNPPGTIETSLPNSTYGLRSTWRGSIRPSMKQGACDRASVGWAMKFRGSARIFALNACALARRAVRPDQHAVAARLADRLHHQRVEMLEHVLPIRRIREQVRLDVGENRLFGEVEANDRRNIGVQRFVVGQSCADGVGNRHVARAVCIQEAGNTEVRVRPKRERIEEIVVHAPVDHVHAAQSRGRAHVDDIVVDEQIASFDERHAHLAREKGVLEVRGVADAWRQHDKGRFRRVCRREGTKRRQQHLPVLRDGPDMMAVEQPWEHTFGDFAVREHV